MHGHIAHFAINADDLPATVGFYEAFRLELRGGLSGFFRSTSAGRRSRPSRAAARCSAVPTNGSECTFAVDDVGVGGRGCGGGGGTVLMAPATIHGVGELAFLT